MGVSLTSAVLLFFTASVIGEVACPAAKCEEGLTQVAEVQGESTEKEPRKAKDIDEMGKRQDACNCCRNCKAATHTVRGKEEGPPLQDGCKDCCEKCGGADMPIPERLPPETLRLVP